MKKNLRYLLTLIFALSCGQRINGMQITGKTTINPGTALSNLTRIKTSWVRFDFIKSYHERSFFPIHEAVKFNQPQTLRLLLEGLSDGEKRELFTTQDQSGRTPLHWAVSIASIVLVELVYHEDAINIHDKDEQNPIEVMFGHAHSSQEVFFDIAGFFEHKGYFKPARDCSLPTSSSPEPESPRQNALHAAMVFFEAMYGTSEY